MSLGPTNGLGLGPHRERPREFVQGLERGLQVIRVLASVTNGRTIAQTARDTGLTRAVARRYLFTLRALGYAVQVGDRFRATPRFLELGLCDRPAIDIGAHLGEALENLLQALGDRCSAAVSVLDGSDVVILAARGEGGMRFESGLRRPAATTAPGHVLLGLIEPRDWVHPANALVMPESHAGLVDRVASAAEAGFAEHPNAVEAGRLELAVPVCDPEGTVLAAFEVSIQRPEAAEDVAKTRGLVLDALRTAAEQLSAAACG